MSHGPLPPLHPRAELHPQLCDSEHWLGRERLGQRARYYPSAGLLSAVNVALSLQRPLLLTGEPGCGKTDFAHACASALGAVLGYAEADCEPLSCTVRSDVRARDLLYLHDAVARFGDAQYGGPQGHAKAQDPRHYITLQALGLALASDKRRVVLIDEIDKAPRDLPNDLLRELDRGDFSIPEIPHPPPTEQPVADRGSNIPLQQEMRRRPQAPLPLVIITSNAETQLPDAFLRRCIFWHIEFPYDQLQEIVLDYFAERMDGAFRRQALDVFRRLRELEGLGKPPATAELLDWLEALTGVFNADEAGVHLDAFGQGQGRRWSELPALSCLIKTRQDLALLSELRT